MFRYFDRTPKVFSSPKQMQCFVLLRASSKLATINERLKQIIERNICFKRAVI